MAPRRIRMHTITVPAGSCMLADAAASTLFGMQPAPAAALLATWTNDL